MSLNTTSRRLELRNVPEKVLKFANCQCLGVNVSMSRFWYEYLNVNINVLGAGECVVNLAASS